MRRLEGHYITKLTPYLRQRTALEIGCGDGALSVQLASSAKHLTSIDSDSAAVEAARNRPALPKLQFAVGRAEALPFERQQFDVVIFTLSFHHLSPDLMSRALAETRRVLRPGGHAIFIEPAFEGTFFEAELRFGCCDGDERRAKAIAYFSMLNDPVLEEVLEFRGQTTFQFDSLENFCRTMHPPQARRAGLDKFLRTHQYQLTARRRINVFAVPE